MQPERHAAAVAATCRMDWHPESIKHGVQAQQAAAMTNDSKKCLFIFPHPAMSEPADPDRCDPPFLFLSQHYQVTYLVIIVKFSFDRILCTVVAFGGV